MLPDDFCCCFYQLGQYKIQPINQMKSLKHFLIIVSIVSFYGTIRADAQTKEETIKWISQKIEQYGSKTIQYYQMGDTWSQELKTYPNGFTQHSWVGGKAYLNLTVMIDYSSITKTWITDCDGDCTRHIAMDGKFIHPDNKIVTHAGIYIPWDYAPDLLNRMFAAFNHLVELNKPK